MRLLASEDARALDRFAEESLGMPSPVLMENAALAVVDVLERRFGDVGNVVLLCGSGNNGGDGLAVARHLVTCGRRPQVLLCAERRRLAGDAALQARLLEGIGAEIREVAEPSLSRAVEAVAGCDLIVDALFGTGLSRPVEGWRRELVRRVNACRTPVLAVDLPSGLSAESPEPPGEHMVAAATVTFFAPKPSLVLHPACKAAGEVWVAPLGLPSRALPAAKGGRSVITARDVPRGEREPQTHKGDFGHLVVVAGAPGKSGAAVLCAWGALRSGVGLVTVAAPEEIRSDVDQGCVEAMTLPLPRDGGARLGASAAESLGRFCTGKDALALGPGLGDEPAAAEWVRDVVIDLDLPLVLDADGINAFAGRSQELRARRAPTVLTPHPGELARLLGRPVPRGSDERLEAVRLASRESGVTVVLKGFQTLVGCPDGSVAVNPTGHPGMATAGSGDVLTGSLGAWLARGIEPEAAARAAVFLHGLAGELAVQVRGEGGTMARDVAEGLPLAMARLCAYRREARRGRAFRVGRNEVEALLSG